eukprot:Em0011g152a
MVFLRACVLGQLQHSHLHQPLFPIEIGQQLQFDRRNDTREHVRIEIIQLSEDCTGITRASLLLGKVYYNCGALFIGGRVLARYEASAHTFLYPDDPGSQDGDVRNVQLTRRSKAVQNKVKHLIITLCDCLVLNTWNRIFSTSTILLEATVHSPVSPPFVGQDTCRPIANLLRAAGLERHPAAASPRPPRSNSGRPEFTIPMTGLGTMMTRKRTIAVAHTRAQASRCTELSLSDIGLHPWQTCPRRTQETLTAHSTPALNLSSLSSSLNNAPRKSACNLTSHLWMVSVWNIQIPLFIRVPPSRVDPDSRPPFLSFVVPILAFFPVETSGGACPALSVVETRATKGRSGGWGREPVVSPPLTATVQREKAEFFKTAKWPLPFGTDEVPTAVFDGPDEKTASIMAEPGNVRSGVLSPARQIEEKLQRLRKECCSHVQHSDVETVVEDNLNEDLNRLSLTVKVGPGDYWSQRMAEYTGHPHRLLFDETLEKDIPSAIPQCICD